jgi:hypothetical protein
MMRFSSAPPSFICYWHDSKVPFILIAGSQDEFAVWEFAKEYTILPVRHLKPLMTFQVVREIV